MIELLRDMMAGYLGLEERKTTFAFSLVRRACTSAIVINAPANGVLTLAVIGSLLLVSFAFCYARKACTSAIVIKGPVEGVRVPSVAGSFP